MISEFGKRVHEKTVKEIHDFVQKGLSAARKTPEYAEMGRELELDEIVCRASSEISVMRNRALKGDESIKSLQDAIILKACKEAIKPYNDGWLNQAARDSQEIVRLETEIESLREQLYQAEQAASDNSDWFDQLCIDLRRELGMPEAKRPFEVTPILEQVKSLRSERKSATRENF